MNVKKVIFYVSLLTLAAMVAIFFLLDKATHVTHDLEPLLPAPAFSLTDSNKKDFHTDSLKNKVWVADFIFTRCGGPCPLLTKHLAGIAKEHRFNPDVEFVTITVDPDFDTPEVLTEYAKRYEANTEKWHFLTGTTEQIMKVMTDGFKLGGAEKLIFHSDKLVLVDRNGQIRRFYEGSNAEDLKNLNRDLKVVLKE